MSKSTIVAVWKMKKKHWRKFRACRPDLSKREIASLVIERGMNALDPGSGRHGIGFAPAGKP